MFSAMFETIYRKNVRPLCQSTCGTTCRARCACTLQGWRIEKSGPTRRLSPSNALGPGIAHACCWVGFECCDTCANFFYGTHPSQSLCAALDCKHFMPRTLAHTYQWRCGICNTRRPNAARTPCTWPRGSTGRRLRLASASSTRRNCVRWPSVHAPPRASARGLRAVPPGACGRPRVSHTAQRGAMRAVPEHVAQSRHTRAFSRAPRHTRAQTPAAHAICAHEPVARARYEHVVHTGSPRLPHGVCASNAVRRAALAPLHGACAQRSTPNSSQVPWFFWGCQCHLRAKGGWRKCCPPHRTQNAFSQICTCSLH